ncbi:hypothetical protein CB1_000362023 [Camelus ferus]|nr:hypothetical protein CB1_000362023 [Camelus ferus]
MIEHYKGCSEQRMRKMDAKRLMPDGRPVTANDYVKENSFRFSSSFYEWSSLNSHFILKLKCPQQSSPPKDHVNSDDKRIGECGGQQKQAPGHRSELKRQELVINGHCGIRGPDLLSLPSGSLLLGNLPGKSSRSPVPLAKRITTWTEDEVHGKQK